MPKNTLKSTLSESSPAVHKKGLSVCIECLLFHRIPLGILQLRH